MRNGSLVATYDTFSSNKVANGDTTSGSATDIYVLSDGSGNQAKATITNSILGQDGLTLVSDFFAGTNAGGTAPNLGSSGPNLVSDNPASPNGLTGTITGTQPNFSGFGLFYNGGSTDTIALTASSTAALGKAIGNGITVDQRGAHRNATTPDLGAFEFTPPPAKTYTVNVATDNSGTSAGSGSGTTGDLRYCLNQAMLDDGSADTIVFASSLAGATITLTSGLSTGLFSINIYGPTAFLVIGNDNITIDGSAAPGLTISGGNAERLFVAAANNPLTLKNLTISGGSAIGGAGGTGGGEGASVGGGGGGGAAGLGGAVFVDGGTFTAAGCTFVNNQAQGGQGGAVASTGGGGGGGGGLARQTPPPDLIPPRASRSAAWAAASMAETAVTRHNALAAAGRGPVEVVAPSAWKRTGAKAVSAAVAVAAGSAAAG